VNRKEKEVAWVLSLLQGKIGIDDIEQLFIKQLDTKSINTLYKSLMSG
jgi:hypothetical protein